MKGLSQTNTPPKMANCGRGRCLGATTKRKALKTKEILESVPAVTNKTHQILYSSYKKR